MLLAKKIFEFHARVQKCHFGNFSFLPKWHFWTRAWNSKNFLAKSILLKHYENGSKIFFCNLSQGLPNPGLMQEKVQKGDFLKEELQELKFFLLFQVPMNLPKAWNTKLGAGSFLVRVQSSNVMTVPGLATSVDRWLTLMTAGDVAWYWSW